ncbi:MAG: hypothetical protein Kow00122_17670 [Thermoleophilia bacterium]
MVGGARNSAWELAKEFTFSTGRALFLAFSTLLIVVLAAAPAPAAGGAPQPENRPVAPVTDFTQRCLTCHSQPYLGQVEVDGRAKSLFVDPTAYKDSVHGLLPCNACHTGFTPDPHQMVSNAEFFAQTAGEACRNCHDDQFEMYKQSYHGTLSRSGSAESEKAPLCVDCHGSHAIQKVNTLAYRQSIQDVCGRCHGGREATYLDTYHGKAVTLGRQAAATCVDCHGSHSILPVANPQSTLSKANILGTCQRCHPEASKGFTTFLVHITPTSPKAPLVVFLVAMFYLVLIIAVFSFGGVHTLLYIYRGLKDGLYFRKGGH